MYWKSYKEEEHFQPTYRAHVVAVIGALIVRSLILIYWQRSIWQENALGRRLLTEPLSDPNPFYQLSPAIFGREGGYFVAFALSRFLLAVVVSLAVSFVFYVILKVLEKKNSRFFMPGETRLGFLCALISGWPGFVFFLPAVFVSVVVVSSVRMMLGHQFTTLGYPMLLASAIALGASSVLQNYLGLWVLKL